MNGKFPEKRTKFSKWFSGNFPFLSILNRKFSAPFDLKLEFSKILVEWNAPNLRIATTGGVLHSRKFII